MCGACGDFIGFASCGGVAVGAGIGLSADTAGRVAAGANDSAEAVALVNACAISAPTNVV